MTPAEAWEKALSSEIGVGFTVDNPELFRQHLYNHKYSTGDLRLEEFEISIAETGEVRIIRSKARGKIRGRTA